MENGVPEIMDEILQNTRWTLQNGLTFLPKSDTMESTKIVPSKENDPCVL